MTDEELVGEIIHNDSFREEVLQRAADTLSMPLNELRDVVAKFNGGADVMKAVGDAIESKVDEEMARRKAAEAEVDGYWKDWEK